MLAGEEPKGIGKCERRAKKEKEDLKDPFRKKGR